MLVEAGAFQTLLSLLRATALAETLEGPGPFTLLAPTDEAFTRLLAGTVDNLLQDRPMGSAGLASHILPGRSRPPNSPPCRRPATC